MARPELASLREELAHLAHEQWSGWMRYLFGKCRFDAKGRATIPTSFVKRWQRQMSTPYLELPEREKMSDRKEADKVIKVMEEIKWPDQS